VKAAGLNADPIDCGPVSRYSKLDLFSNSRPGSTEFGQRFK